MSYRNHWVDAPLEIRDKIVGHCDPPSLLILSQVNHQLNFLALSHYFAQQIKGDTIQLPGKLSLENLSQPWKYHEVMRVLRIAFWLPERIQHIDYCFASMPKYCHYVNDLCEIIGFIHRMPKLVSLRIDAGLIQNDSDMSKHFHCDIWNKLFATAISKGCELLDVKESDITFCEHPFPLSLLNPIQIYGWLPTVKLVHATMALALSSPPNSSNHPFARVVRPSASLREVQLDGGCFERTSPSFLMRYRTLITRLSLKGLDVWDIEKLDDIFNYIHFVALEHFTFSDSDIVSPLVFLNFLDNHSTLTDLDLHVDVRSYLQSSQGGSIWSRRPTFPHLRNLRTFPEALRWLVPDFRQYPKLRSVALKGDSWSTQNTMGDYAPQDVIRSILDDLHALPSMAWPLKFEVELPLDNFGWLTRLWAPANGEALSCWSRVKELRLKGINPNPLDPTIPKTLVKWLSTFPSLEYLEIESIGHAKYGQNLVELLAKTCPEFRSLKIFLDPTHPRLPRGWEEWVLQDGKFEKKIYSTDLASY